MSKLFEQVKETFATEPAVLEGGLDTELLESALRLNTGLFTGRVHVTYASCSEGVDVYGMQFCTPMVGLEWKLTVDKGYGTYELEEA